MWSNTEIVVQGSQLGVILMESASVKSVLKKPTVA